MQEVINWGPWWKEHRKLFWSYIIRGVGRHCSYAIGTHIRGHCVQGPGEAFGEEERWGFLPGSVMWTPKWGPPMSHFSFLYLNFFLNDISVIIVGPTRVIMWAKQPYNSPWFEDRKSSWNEKRILVCKIGTFSIATWPNTFISILFLVRKPKSRGMMSLYFKILKIKLKVKELTESQLMY